MRFSVFHPWVPAQSRGTWNFLRFPSREPPSSRRSLVKEETGRASKNGPRNMGLILDLLFSFRRWASSLQPFPSLLLLRGGRGGEMYQRLGCANFFRRSKEISRKGTMSEMYKHEADPRQEKLKAGQTEINK